MRYIRRMNFILVMIGFVSGNASAQTSDPGRLINLISKAPVVKEIRCSNVSVDQNGNRSDPVFSESYEYLLFEAQEGSKNIRQLISVSNDQTHVTFKKRTETKVSDKESIYKVEGTRWVNQYGSWAAADFTTTVRELTLADGSIRETSQYEIEGVPHTDIYVYTESSVGKNEIVSLGRLIESTFSYNGQKDESTCYTKKILNDSK